MPAGVRVVEEAAFCIFQKVCVIEMDDILDDPGMIDTGNGPRARDPHEMECSRKSPMQIVHFGGLFPPSSGPAKTLCGLSLPFNASNFFILGFDPPKRHRTCQTCKIKQKERAKRFAK
jgi:hypothetical protein